MMHCGMGPDDVVNFLTSLNMRGICTKSLTARMNEIGGKIIEAAEESMNSALELECRYV